MSEVAVYECACGHAWQVTEAMFRTVPRFSSLALCAKCGAAPVLRTDFPVGSILSLPCTRCGLRITSHAGQEATCANCGADDPPVSECPSCHATIYQPEGYCRNCGHGKPPDKPELRLDGELCGFRMWALQGHELCSSNAGMHAWTIGVNKGECLRTRYRAYWALKETNGNQGPPADKIAEVRAIPPDADHHAPEADCECVPLDTEILTQRGWLTHDQVKAGDRTLGINPETRHTEWTTIRAVHHRDSGALVRVGNDYWSARCTPDHRWPVWEAGRQHFVAAADLPGDVGMWHRHQHQEPREIVTRAPYVGGAGPLTPTEAALIAWLYTDGIISRQTITQQKPAGVAALKELLSDVPHTEREYHAGVHYFRLRTPYYKALWEKADLPTTPLAQLVLTLTRPALKAFMEAAWLAEGGWNGKAKTLTQNAGEVADALTLGVYLLGFRPRVHVHDSASSYSPRRGVCRRITYASSPIRGQRLSVESLEPEPTWCVTTDLGSWTMRQDEQILPTGNCGLYAVYGPWDNAIGRFFCHGPKVYGAIAAWGKLGLQPEGFRAEYARVVALAVTSADDLQADDPRRGSRLLYDEHAERVQSLAEEFGVAFCRREELLDVAAEFGELVPELLKPGKVEARAYARGGFLPIASRPVASGPVAKPPGSSHWMPAATAMGVPSGMQNPSPYDPWAFAPQWLREADPPLWTPPEPADPTMAAAPSPFVPPPPKPEPPERKPEVVGPYSQPWLERELRRCAWRGSGCLAAWVASWLLLAFVPLILGVLLLLLSGAGAFVCAFKADAVLAALRRLDDA